MSKDFCVGKQFLHNFTRRMLFQNRSMANMKLNIFLGVIATWLLVLNADAQFVPDYGQLKPNTPRAAERWQDRLVYAGNISFNFSANNTFIDVSPAVLYAVTPKFLIGPGVNYLYRRFDFGNNQRVDGHNYGGRIMSRYTIYQNFYAAGELLAMNVDAPSTLIGGENSREWFVNPQLGGGAYFQLSGRSAFTVTVLYNFNQDMRLNPYRFFGNNPGWNIQMGVAI